MITIIRVTVTDIKQGCPNSAYHCPISLAIQRVFPKRRPVTWVRVDGHIDGMHIESLNPKLTEAFVDAFDNHKEVKPFSFKLKMEVKKHEN
jgi:hypothetical protein